MHIVLALSLEPPERHDEAQQEILGGVCCEHYPASNSGLVTYIAVSSKAKGTGLSHPLIASVLSALTQTSKSQGHPGCSAIFLETNSDAVDPTLDVMLPSVRRRILFRLGFRVLRFAYVQPRLSEAQDKCRDLYLAVHQSSLESDTVRLRAEVLLRFLREFYVVLQGEESLLEDEDYVEAERWLREREFVEAFVEPV